MDDQPSSKNIENQQQAEYWNNVSGPKWAEEDDTINYLLQPVSDGLFDRVRMHEGSNLLDIGCGGGITTALAAEKVGATGTVLGVDISESLLKVARERCKKFCNVAFLREDAQAYPFAPSKYEQIISRFGVMFFENPVKAFQNIRKALIRGGELKFACWGPLDLNEFFFLPMDIVLREIGRPRPPLPEGPGPLSLSAEPHITNILGQAGFSNVSIDTWDGSLSRVKDCAKLAKFLLKIGIGAKLLGENDVDQSTFNKIYQNLSGRLEDKKKGGYMSLKIGVHFVSAEN